MFATKKLFPTLPLKSHDLTLRQIREQDAESWLMIVTDPLVKPMLPSSFQISALGEARQSCIYLRDFFTEGRGIFWAIADTNDQMIGSCGFEKIDTTDQRAELAFDLRSDHHGQGIMSSVIKTICTYGFGSLGLNRIEAMTVTENDAAMRTLRKAYFEHEGTLKEYRSFQGHFVDVHIFGLTVNAWLSCL